LYNQLPSNSKLQSKKKVLLFQKKTVYILKVLEVENSVGNSEFRSLKLKPYNPMI
jgi:hypothetical protein